MRVSKRTGLAFQLVQVAAAAAMAALPGLLAACASSGAASGTSTSNTVGNGHVITLNKIDTLKSLFNHDDGRTRLILIFSPT